MGGKTLHHNLDGASVFTDTRTKEEAHQENLDRIREYITDKIHSSGYDEIWHRNVALGLIEDADIGRQYIANLRAAYHDYKARLLASSRDEADSIKFEEPNNG